MKGFKHGLRKYALLAVATGLTVSHAGTAAPQPSEATTLRQLAERFEQRFEQRRTSLFHSLKSETSGAQGALNRNPDFDLIGIDERGRPIVYHTMNLPSARTIRTDEVWVDGASGLELDGSTLEQGEMGIWDAGAVLATHDEFGGRVVSGDSGVTVSDHATHVAGTMIAEGLRATAIGMAYQAPLTSFEWDNDFPEMAFAAGEGMIVSNHSYGPATGWEYSFEDNIWYWYGDPSISETEDYQFGYYDSDAQAFDEIAYSAPDYLIVRAAGNDRLQGPLEALEHYVFVDGSWQLSTTQRLRDGGENGIGYDAISHGAGAKNVLSVGGVEQINGGYLYPEDVRIASMSSYGPMDDGRIKPDVVAVGLFVESTSSEDGDGYRNGSGTSVAAPSVAGSAALLQELWRETHGGTNPRSATLRGLITHTAEEAGDNLGPDYIYGWGLMNTRRAAELIEEDGHSRARVLERSLTDGEADTILVRRITGTPIRVTLAWTDPAADLITPALDDTSSMLVNDLDIRLSHVSVNQTYRPYILDPADPGAAATTGDNRVDNIEQIYARIPADGLYTLIVSHKGTLVNDAQEYTLCLSGLRVEDDIDYPAPRYASSDLSATDGSVELNWAYVNDYPSGLELVYYDDDEPSDTSPAVGTTMGTYFDIDQTCEILELHIYTEANRPNLEFEAYLYETINGIPEEGYNFQYIETYADDHRWNVLAFDPNWYDPISEPILVAFRSFDSGIGLGIDSEDNEHGWSKASGSWERVPTTFYIRMLVEYEDGNSAMLLPDGLPVDHGLDELDEFMEFQVWRNSELIATTDTIHYVDHLTEPGEYEYRITALYSDGSSIASNPTEVEFAGVDVAERHERTLPNRFEIKEAWPNPFNAQVTAEVALPRATKLRAEVYDVLGRKVATLSNAVVSAGTLRLTWRADNASSGVYFLRVETGQGEVAIRKLSLIR
ncbi:S8 family serine peptidase [bacterium]|nr:S8 family serine peptidase [bacterium]